ncbi:MAG: hypothetical protein CMP57_01620 [Flavobacteriales bacterium]|nr:hypothetical protein [Flavobacteriales bacterium]|tara:strand:+ start:4479 stop:4790 length:312 start_codon:yes stop_codon:yes gene_type:complete
MIIYNVTVNIEESSEYEWLLWMQKHHIPRVMKTGLFVSSKMTKVLIEEQTGGVTYSIQYSCENKKKLSDYQTIYAPKLQKEHEVKYAGKFVAFRTLLKVICEF